MEKVEASSTAWLNLTLEVMARQGLLLVSSKPGEKPNVMTIGWGTIGLVWGKDIFAVLVRPSRYTFNLIEASGEFTVNVPAADMQEITNYCGTVSGRDHDKFREKKVTPAKSQTVSVPIIEECLIHYECRVVHKNDVVARNLTPEIESGCYGGSDYHRVYFGEIMRTCTARDVEQRLR